MSIKKTIIGAGLASTVVAASLEKRATLPFEAKIYTSCVTPGQVALTFDDGPYIYTQKIVDALTAGGHKATFFQNGQNYGNIYDYGALLQSMLAGGHQIGSHTWNHPDLATLDAAGVTAQMNQLEAAHIALIGKAPTYMRPPFLSTNSLVLDTLTSLKFHVISVDVDTQDFAEGPAGRIQNSIDWFQGNVSAGGSIVLNHDVHQATADTFVPAAIKYLDGLGKKSVTVGTCLGDDPANWYRGGNVSPSASASASSRASASASAAASGSAGASSVSAPAPSGSAAVSGSGPKPSGSAAASGAASAAPSGAKPSGYPSPSGGATPGKPVPGGDTEPGHGPNAGRGAMPGKQGSGNQGWTAPSPSGSSTYPASNGTSPAKPSSVYTGPYSNGASTLGGSALALAAAAVAAFLL